MLLILVYLTTLLVAPQLWIEPFVGMRVDFYVYPAWMLAVLIGRGRLLPLTAADYFFVLMIFWIVLSSAANGFTDRTTEIIVNYSKWFVLYKLVAASTENMERLRRVTWMLVSFGLLLAWEGIEHKLSPTGLGWAGQALGWIDPGAAEQGEPGRTQWINIFDGPGVFCVVYTIALPFVLQYLHAPFARSWRLVAVAMLAVLAVAIYFTGSRGGFLTALGLIGLHFAIRLGIGPIRIAAVGGALALLFMLAPDHLTTMDDQSKSAYRRVAMWVEGVEMAQQNPVFGIGKGNFLNYTNKLIAHNSAIEVMGETGLVGLFLWLGLIYCSLKNIASYVAQSQDPAGRSYAIALGLCVIGYLMSAMFVTLEYETFYFLLGLCAVPGRALEEPPKFGQRDFMLVGAATIGWFIIVKLFVMIYFG